MLQTEAATEDSSGLVYRHQHEAEGSGCGDPRSEPAGDGKLASWLFEVQEGQQESFLAKKGHPNEKKSLGLWWIQP